MSLEDILQWIDRRFVCGTLTIERGSTTRFFQFDSGYITNSGSNENSEHLGQILINRGLVTEAQLDEAFAVQGDTGVLLGKILIMVGAVDEKQLAEILEDKVRDSLCDTLTWDDGSFRFEPSDEHAPVSEYEISVNLSSAMDEWGRRAEEWNEIRAIIPSDEVALRVINEGAIERAGDAPDRRAAIQRLVGAVRKGLTINQICAELQASKFRVERRLAELVERGALQVVRPSAAPAAAPSPAVASPPPPGLPPAPAPGNVEQGARDLAAAGDKTGALEMARAALARDPDNGALQTLHRDLERAVFAELSRDFLSSFRVPKLLKSAQELAQMELTDTERYMAGRIDGHWDLLSLMRNSPLREVEALITFKRLADRGIISL